MRGKLRSSIIHRNLGDAHDRSSQTNWISCNRVGGRADEWIWRDGPTKCTESAKEAATDVLPGHLASSAEELPGVSPERRNRAHAVRNVQTNTALRASDQNRNPAKIHAALVRGSKNRKVF